MKNQIKSAVLLLLSTLLLIACAKTPESEIIVQKDVDRLAEKATEEAENRKTISENQEETPEHYTFSYETEDKALCITVDAQVELPDVETMPMYYLQCDGFTQEQVTALYDYLFQGAETFRYEGSDFTKSDCEKEMVKLRERLAELEESTKDAEYIELEKDDLKKSLEDLEQRYDTLPEASTLHKVAVDSTLMDQPSYQVGEAEEGGFQGMYCYSEDGGFLSVENRSLDSAGWPGIYYEKQTSVSYDPDGGVSVAAGEADAKTAEGMTMTCDKAREIADGLFAAMGIDAKLMQIFLQQGYTETGDEQENTLKIDTEDEYTAFRFVYTRVIDDIPVAVISSNTVSGDETALVWGYEMIQVHVTEDGIQEIIWDYPVSIKEKTAEDTNIYSFADACKVFEEMAPLIYGGKLEESNLSSSDISETLDVKVSRVELNLMRVKDSGSERTGLYVPAWVFYGVESSHFHSSTITLEGESDWSNASEEPWIVMAVNAVDGTVIDVVEGY